MSTMNQRPEQIQLSEAIGLLRVAKLELHEGNKRMVAMSLRSIVKTLEAVARSVAPSVAENIALLKSDIDAKVIAAAKDLGGLGAEARSSVPALIDLLSHENKQVRETAAWTLEQIFKSEDRKGKN